MMSSYSHRTCHTCSQEPTFWGFWIRIREISRANVLRLHAYYLIDINQLTEYEIISYDQIQQIVYFGLIRCLIKVSLGAQRSSCSIPWTAWSMSAKLVGWTPWILVLRAWFAPQIRRIDVAEVSRTSARQQLRNTRSSPYLETRNDVPRKRGPGPRSKPPVQPLLNFDCILGITCLEVRVNNVSSQRSLREDHDISQCRGFLTVSVSAQYLQSVLP